MMSSTETINRVSLSCATITVVAGLFLSVVSITAAILILAGIF